MRVTTVVRIPEKSEGQRSGVEIPGLNGVNAISTVTSATAQHRGLGVNVNCGLKILVTVTGVRVAGKVTGNMMNVT